ncbi:DNA protecting protein DprA [Lactobacillus pasteurii DSM 23907 = CRBIP 24.76]|nr:DNA protecting protein DprA [Lactobacillus pasteurii DSM 23907 = CRBIP 24.76]
MLQIACKIDVDEIDLVQLNALDLPYELRQACIKAFLDETAELLIDKIKKQCQVISFFDQEYPSKLRQIYRPPLILFARGDISLLKKEIVTIVGSRMATNYSQTVLTKLVPNLVKDQIVVASGLAKGVDAIAHRATLDSGGKTIAVVGNGLNYYYPSQNESLQKKIIQQGLVISEYLPDTRPKPFRFPERNRILAGLSKAVVITEAKVKSGSLITANLALQENRDVYALPGPITSPLSEGPNRLIEAGAIPVTDFVLEK